MDDTATSRRIGDAPQGETFPARPHAAFAGRTVETIRADAISDDTISSETIAELCAQDPAPPASGRVTGSERDLGDVDSQPTGARAEAGSGETKLTFFERVEAWISRLSTRNTFWHRVCSFIWLPYAYKSGIALRRIDENDFVAVLPFRRMNRNWYNAMAGAALLGNSEIAGGMYVFGKCGGDYTVVCKHLEYKFQRPCFGAAIYRITPREDIQALLKTGTEFNITLDLLIAQQPRRTGEKEKRIGRCEVTFHVTPKSQWRARKARAAAAASR